MFEARLLRLKSRLPPGMEAWHDELTDLGAEKQRAFQGSGLRKICKDLFLPLERFETSLADRN